MSDRMRYGVHRIDQRSVPNASTETAPTAQQLADRLTRIADIAHERERSSGICLVDYGTGGIESPVEQITLTADDLRLIVLVLRGELRPVVPKQPPYSFDELAQPLDMPPRGLRTDGQR